MASNGITDIIWSKGENPEEPWDEAGFMHKLESDATLIKLWSKDAEREHLVPLLRASITERVELMMLMKK